MNPFEDWMEHNPDSCTACAEHGVVEQFNLDERRRALADLPPEPGHWSNPASLTRFDADQMSGDQLSRFLKKVTPQQIDWHTPCWLWKGGTHEKGYGRFFMGLAPESEGGWREVAQKNISTGKVEVVVKKPRVHAYTHRIAFEHWIGFPPRGYIVDHQCNHKLCCNPTHLWPETNNNNLRLADQRRPWKRRNQYSKE